MGWATGELGVYDPQLGAWQTLLHEAISQLKIGYKLVATMNHGLLLITNNLQRVYSFTKFRELQGESNGSNNDPTAKLFGATAKLFGTTTKFLGATAELLHDWTVPHTMLIQSNYRVMSVMADSVVVCFVKMCQAGIEARKMLWMDTLLAPGIWHSGPPLQGTPISVFTLDSDAATETVAMGA